MKIIIPDPLPASAITLLESEGWNVDAQDGRSQEQLARDVVDADALIVRSATKVTSEIINATRNLRVIGRAGTGVDNVDLVSASEKGILVINAPGANSISVAEHAFALMLSSARSIPQADAKMKAGVWDKKMFRGSELRDKTLGIIGLGRIGREVAQRAHAFDMNVVAHDPFVTTQAADKIGIELIGLEDLGQRSDFITLHLPSTAQTKQLIDRNFLSHCKNNVRIINTARGDLIDEDALEQAILEGRIGGAALDVYKTEPPGVDSIATTPGVVATPHIAASTNEAQKLVGLETATAVRDYLKAGVVRNAVNYSSVGPEQYKLIKPYLVLAERMASLLAQLAKSRIEGLGIRYYGPLADGDNEMIVGSAVVGLFKHILSSSVSLVNARPLAEQRGLEIIESRSARPRNFTHLISLKLRTEKGEHWAEGTVFEPDRPRIVRLDDVEVEVPLAGTLIIIRNEDRPGVIGEVGSVLGRHGINISSFSLGRSNNGAVGVVRISDELTPKPAASHGISSQILSELEDIRAVQSVHLVGI